MSYNWLNKQSRTFLERDYLQKGISPEQRIEQIAINAENLLGMRGFAAKFISYMEKGWISLSTPVWTNFGTNNNGLPISCFGGVIQDNTADILRASAEVGMLSKYAGGTAMNFSKIRGRGTAISGGGTSNGSVSFAEIFNTLMNIVSQGKTRRGNFAGYWSITHDDFYEVMQIKSEGHPIQDISIGITIPAGFMEVMLAGNKEYRKRWAKVIQKRYESGYPYILFEDNVEKGKPQVYKDLNLPIYTSQLCSEILEYADENNTFTCCLASVNLLHYDEWKDTDLVETVTMFLDAVMTSFIKESEGIPFLEKARNFAINHRSIGLGVLGWHSYLQSKSVAFESMEAKQLTAQIFKNINEQSLITSKVLAASYGEPTILKGYGERFTTRIAIAPTTSSSFILGQVSPSIEPLHSNYFVKDLAKGKFVYKNPYLKQVLKNYGADTLETWDSILKHGGSVQHLSILTEHEKNVFKTFAEISQMEVVIQASIRQKFIDQSQSLNLMIDPATPAKDVSELLITAWKLGVKTLYYQRGVNAAQQVARDILSCSSCE